MVRPLLLFVISFHGVFCSFCGLVPVFPAFPSSPSLVCACLFSMVSALYFVPKWPFCVLIGGLFSLFLYFPHCFYNAFSIGIFWVLLSSVPQLSDWVWIANGKFQHLSVLQFIGRIVLGNVAHHSGRPGYSVSSEVHLLLDRAIA